MWDQQCCLAAVGVCLVAVGVCPVVGEEEVGVTEARPLVVHLIGQEKVAVQETANCLRERKNKNVADLTRICSTYLIFFQL